MRYYAIVIPHRYPASVIECSLADIINNSSWLNEKIDADYFDSSGITQEEYAEMHPEYAKLWESHSPTDSFEPFEPWSLTRIGTEVTTFADSQEEDYSLALHILSDDAHCAYLIPESELADFKYSHDSHQGYLVNDLLADTFEQINKEKVYLQNKGLKVFTELRDGERSTHGDAIERLGELLGSDPSGEVIRLIIVQTGTGYALRRFEFV